jgi:hypothetical protein
MGRDKPSRTTLDELPGRLLALLSGIGKSKVIRGALDAKGYSDEEHDLGWTLLKTIGHYKAPRGPGQQLGMAVDPVVRAAIVELDNWDEPNFARIEAILQRAFPAQADFLFDGLTPQTGAAAIMSVSTLLGRLDALESGADRKATHKQDLAALKLLAERSYTKAERDRLAALVSTATKGAGATAPDGDPGDAKARDEHAQAELDAHAWYKEWSTTARNEIKRRDYLILLGLASRRKPDKPEPAVPAPTTPAAPGT